MRLALKYTQQKIAEDVVKINNISSLLESNCDACTASQLPVCISRIMMIIMVLYFDTRPAK